MPTVPRYDPQVQTAGVQLPRVPTEAPIEAFGGGAANAPLERAGQQIGGTFQQLAAKEKESADQVAVLDYASKLSSLETKLLYDPQTGALTKQKKDAFDLPETVRDQYTNATQAYDTDLTNEDQRLMARKVRDAHWSEIDKKVQLHVAAQRDAYDQEVTKSYLDNEQNAAIENYYDPTRISAAIANQKQALTEQAQRNGQSPEWLQEQLAEVTSKTHSSVIARMLANQKDKAAQTYYDEHRDEITGQDATKLEAALKEGSKLGEAQRAATEIMGKYGNDLTGAVAAARQLDDPKLQEETVREVKSRHDELQKSMNENDEARYRIAANVVEATKDRPNALVWSQLTLPQRNSLDSRIEQLRKGITPETDWNTYYDLKTQASTPELKDKFLRTNLLQFRSKLADSEFKEVVGLQSGLRKGDENADKLLNGFRSDSQIVNDTLNSAGIDPTPKKGSDDATKVARFRQQVDDGIREIQERTGKKASTDDVQKIVDQLMMKVRVPGRFWGTNQKSLFETTPAERDKVSVTVDDVPKDDREAITRELVRHGQQVNDDAVVRWYLKGLTRGGR